MYLPTSPKSVLGATLVAGTLLASPAMARPMADPDLRAEAGTSSLAGTVAKGQDLRGEHARDAAASSGRTVAVAPAQDLRGEHARDAARPAVIAPVDTAAPATRTAPQALPVGGDGRNPETWLLVAVGLAGAGIVAGGTAGVVRARRIA